MFHISTTKIKKAFKVCNHSLNLFVLNAENPTTQVILSQINMFLSLHQLVTKYQTPNVMSVEVLFLFQLENRRGSLASSLFELRQ